MAKDFSDAESSAPLLLYSEETITERFLLDLARTQKGWSNLKLQIVSIAHVKTGSTARSEPVTGADWEWHFVAAKNKQSFGVRIQAKKANDTRNVWGYTDIAAIHKKRLPSGMLMPTMPQIDKLISDAKKNSCWPAYALYDTRFGTANGNLLRCGLCPRLGTAFGGVTHTDARAMRWLIRRKQKLTRGLVRTISSPLPCMVDCPFAVGIAGTLPERVRQAAQLMTRPPAGAVDDDEFGVPELSRGLPPHVNEILAAASDARGPLYRIDGTWSIRRETLDDVPAREGDAEEGPLDNLAGIAVITAHED
jgi:hypothetical protein